VAIDVTPPTKVPTNAATADKYVAESVTAYVPRRGVGARARAKALLPT
jgi:hypothetical protein